jgi:hypothetical protein
MDPIPVERALPHDGPDITGRFLVAGGLGMAGGGGLLWLLGWGGAGAILLAVLGVVLVLAGLHLTGHLPGWSRRPFGDGHAIRMVGGLGLMGAPARAAPAIDIYDPAERRRLMDLPAGEQEAILMDIMRAVPELGRQFAQANSWWNMFPGRVVATAQQAIPGITRPEVAALVAAYRRIHRG